MSFLLNTTGAFRHKTPEKCLNTIQTDKIKYYFIPSFVIYLFMPKVLFDH
jgi:hypothetical protein